MMALAFERESLARGQALAQRDADITALKAKLTAYEKDRAAGLPTSTTKAGISAGRPAAGDFENIHDAGLAAWVEAGGKREDYR